MIRSYLLSFINKWLLKVLLLAGLYFAAAKLGLTMAFEATNASPVWPPTGIALSAVLLMGYRIWPGIILGAFSVNLLTFHTNGLSMATAIPISAGIALGNTLEAVIGAYLVYRFVGGRDFLEQAQDVFKFITFAVIPATMISAFIGVINICLGGVAGWSDFPYLWWIWWIGDTVGALVVTPFLIVWLGRDHIEWKYNRFPEAVFLFALLLIATILSFTSTSTSMYHVYRHLEYLIIPLIVWATFRFGQPGATAIVLITSIITVGLTVQGFGPFISTSPNDSLLLLQLYLAVTVLTTLFLTSVLKERQTARQALKKAHNHLEKRVDQRTTELFHTNTLLLQQIESHKKTSKQQQLITQILQLLNGIEKGIDTIQEISKLIKVYTGLDAVGIRLIEDDDYPYYETSGFTEDFLVSERYLCTRGQDGNIIRDPQGKPELECMCGNVIRGRTDSELSFFTEAGSFWSNCTTELLASTTNDDRQGRTRNRCNAEGYESVALIPLKEGEEIIGLLQLNDHRNEMFTLEMIHFFEDLGASIGVAFLRKQSEIALLSERDKLQEALEKVKTLSGLLPICSSCKKIRDDKGYWNHLETYVSTHSDAEFSHSLCPGCAEELYPEMNIRKDKPQPQKVSNDNAHETPSSALVG